MSGLNQSALRSKKHLWLQGRCASGDCIEASDGGLGLRGCVSNAFYGSAVPFLSRIVVLCVYFSGVSRRYVLFEQSLVFLSVSDVTRHPTLTAMLYKTRQHLIFFKLARLQRLDVLPMLGAA